MSVLTLKMIRDLWRAKWQYLAVGAMVFLGVVFFNASYSAYVNLRDSYDTSYLRLYFEDFGITFNAAPERIVKRVQSITGVTASEGRLVEDVQVQLPGQTTKQLVGRLISIPTDHHPKVDDVKVVQGRYLSSSTAHEVLLEASFAKYHNLKPGDFIEALRGSGRVRFKIAGIVQSPEYLYVVRSKQSLIPFPDTFGVMFVSKDVLGPLMGMTGEINEIRATIDQPSRLNSIMRQAKSALSIYHPNDAVPRKDQPSSQMLEQDVEGFRMYAILFPAFFLSVAALTVYTLLMRMVYQQRPMIGLLRSLGYSNAAVVAHYMAGAFMIGILFSLLGTAAGFGVASWTSYGYMSFLQVPFEMVLPRWPVLGFGIAIGTAVCLLAGFFPARVAAAIQPAEAMRPVIPTFGARWAIFDRLLPNLKLLYRIPMRNIFRQPKRTLSTLFGIVAGLALMITAKGLLDSENAAVNQILTGAFRYDLRVDFITQEPYYQVSRVRSWPGVVWAEGTLAIPVDMKHGDYTYSSLITGLESGTRLTQLQDAKGKPITLTTTGAVFGQTLRKKVHLEVGDTVQIMLAKELAKEPPTTRLIRVAAFNDEAMGTQAYAPLSKVQQMFNKDLELPPHAISGVDVKCDPTYLTQTKQRLLSLDGAGSVSSIPDMRKMFENMLQTMQTFIWIMELFGAALAFAMIFNMVTINVLEREAEVATLRTIGVSRWQIARTIVFENTLITLMGLIVGLPFARLFIEWFWQAAQTEQQQELFTFNVQVATQTYVLGAFMIVLVALVSQIPSLVRVSRLDLAKSTKERAT